MIRRPVTRPLLTEKQIMGIQLKSLCVTKLIKKDWLYVEGYERWRLPLVPRSR